jgi:uncharacterized protein (TIGR04255 family)
MGKIQNSPLVEAIFELRWGERQQGQFEFPKEELDFFPGIFSQAVKNQGFIFSEKLNNENANLVLPFVVKHRFRAAENVWPCIQIGLGVFTINQIGNVSASSADKDDYDWDTFKPQIESGLESLDASYPAGLEGLRSLRAILRYQDAFILGASETLESFVNNKMKTNIKVSDSFTDHPNISIDAKKIKLEFEHEVSTPDGVITISVMSAEVNGSSGIVMDTVVSSIIDDEKKTLRGLIEWCEEAHEIQRHAFDTIIQTHKL